MESKISEPVNGIINISSSNISDLKIINETIDDSTFKINNKVEPVTIEINSDDNKIQFFLRILGHNWCHYKVDKGAYLNELIKRYIEIKHIERQWQNFYYGDKEIINQTIDELKIFNLNIINIILK